MDIFMCHIHKGSIYFHYIPYRGKRKLEESTYVNIWVKIHDSRYKINNLNIKPSLDGNL